MLVKQNRYLEYPNLWSLFEEPGVMPQIAYAPHCYVLILFDDNIQYIYLQSFHWYTVIEHTVVLKIL